MQTKTYKNYDVPDYNLQSFLDVLSGLQSEIKASWLTAEEAWRLTILTDQTEETVLDQAIQSFKDSRRVVNASNY